MKTIQNHHQEPIMGITPDRALRPGRSRVDRMCVGRGPFRVQVRGRRDNREMRAAGGGGAVPSRWWHRVDGTLVGRRRRACAARGARLSPDAFPGEYADARRLGNSKQERHARRAAQNLRRRPLLTRASECVLVFGLHHDPEAVCDESRSGLVPGALASSSRQAIRASITRFVSSGSRTWMHRTPASRAGRSFPPTNSASPM